MTEDQKYILDRIVEEDRGHETLCWIWQLSFFANGYGVAHYPGTTKSIQAHILSYETFIGPREHPNVNHLCIDSRDCVNPKHLYNGTQAQNNHDTAAQGRNSSQKRTHCKEGHALVDGNIRFNPRRPTARGECQICKKTRSRKYNQLVKEARFILGLTITEYRRRYGMSKIAAQSIIDAKTTGDINDYL